MDFEFVTERRKFLKSATIFGGLAALLGVVRPEAAERKEPQRQGEGSSQGYRLTEHVKKYYETARL